ncbi:hypothetical protein BD311DRAFT_654485 [Dichomitus squalens]|uniref:Uncharacterized protein n=1 Tax=Dichomitus squalens TaxID=114155 RepID=A0A4Q9MXS6_9APHY|nr:hypothetical protein BD311DRAFT_654485 [Dichomitus squalens]
MAFPPDEAKLVSIFVQTLLYGAYIVVFILTVWVLLSKRQHQSPTRDPMLWITIVMFLMATLHIGINYTRIIKAFIIHRNAPGGPAAFFNQLSEFTQIFGSTVYVAQTLIGDTVVLYRCYLVWGRWYVIVVPSVLLVGSTVSGIGILYSFARVVPEANIFVKELQDWILSFFSLTLATNILCTGTFHLTSLLGLVALRIWQMNRAIMNFVNHSYHPIIFLVLESGMVYSATLLTLLVLYKTGSWFQYVLLDAISSIVGLVFSMMIVRIGLGITSMNGTSAHTTTSDTATRTTISGRTSAFQRIPLQFAPPSQASNLTDGEMSLQDLNRQTEAAGYQEHLASKKRAVSTWLPGNISANARGSCHSA